MTRRAVESVIGRATLDEVFRDALFADPDATLAGFALTQAEMAALRAIDAESVEFFARSPGVSMARLLMLQHNANGDTVPENGSRGQ